MEGIGAVDEFNLIRHLIKASGNDRMANHDSIVIPPGDDACLLTAVKRPVITTDTQREGVHFERHWQTLAEIGLKAVTVTLSDLAASYARPVSLFINLGLPARFPLEEAETLYKGIGIGLEKYGCALGGGNLSNSDRLSLDLFAIGDGHESIFPLRSNAKPEEGIYCTGPLGLARAGLEALRKSNLQYRHPISCFKTPRARFDAAAILARHGVICAMDISDGLKGDALHIAEASHLTIDLSIEDRYLAPDLVSYCSEMGFSAHDFALAGGEDYELLFTCSRETFRKIAEELPDAYAVGSCRPFTGELITAPPSLLSSFQHG